MNERRIQIISIFGIIVIALLLGNKLIPDPKSAQLSVSDLVIVDGTGEIVKLHGIQVMNSKFKHESMSGKDASNAVDACFSEQDVLNLKNKKVNLIDFSHLKVGDVINSDGSLNMKIFTDWIDYWTTWCLNEEIYCIINFSDMTIGNQDGYNYNMPLWAAQDYGGLPNTTEKTAEIVLDFWDDSVFSMDDERELWVKAWVAIADRYKNNPYVMYSLVNEPIHHTMNYATDERIAYLGQSYSRICTKTIKAIRETESNQIVFVDIPYVIDSNNTRFTYVTPIEGENIVWEHHQFNSNYHSLTEWKESIDEAYDKIVTEFQKPLFIGEFGIWPTERRYELEDWKSELTEMVNYTGKLVGYEFHAFDWLTYPDDSFYGYTGYYYVDVRLIPRAYTSIETVWLFETIY
ncbi:MAG: cellulase family glycosylhydrolase [Candidatus Hodarchaeales archaeon]